MNHLFVSEDAATNRPPTELVPADFNAWQEELMAIIEAAGIAPSALNFTQVLAALRSRGVVQQSKINAISADVVGNALVVGMKPCAMDFRNATLTNGTPNTRIIPAALSLTVPAGATLGTSAGVAARLNLLLIDNAGTPELAIANAGGGLNFDEMLTSTTAISAASNSASVVYSGAARANVPCRLVGFVDITEAVPGTWATAPTVVQGNGGNAMPSGPSPLLGTKTNDNAPAGYIGEYAGVFIPQASAIALSNGVGANIASAVLQPGDYDVVGTASFNPAATTTISRVWGSISESSGIPGTEYAQNCYPAGFAPGANPMTFATPSARVTVPAGSTKTIYLVLAATFATSTLGGFGSLQIRRRR
ncbi:hypothetical protein [Ferriphaselus sp. R-1]|uniref:hypothetical protein n=1 Tax=Ferriphaselus sp. R-1 TaxID=1485544 RepID=UPI0012690A53|nr:hypothetical protein [Ferriphaselus sp. R-1]